MAGSPVALLLAVGTLAGSMLALSKVAIAGGVAPLAYAFWQAFGGGLILLAASVVLRRPLRLKPRHLRYYGIAGLLTIALPNALIFAVVPHLGAGLAGTVFALPPLATVALLSLAGKQRLGLQCLLGLGTGLAGALLVIWSAAPGGSAAHAASGWMLLALAVPLVLALGNIYRSLDWPEDASSLPLAAGMLLAAAGLLLPLMLLTGGGYAPFALATRADLIVVAQSAITAVTYVLYFQLQRVAGPVYLSQIGYVMMLTGVVSGALLGEKLAAPALLAMLLILAGVALVSNGRARSLAAAARAA